MRDAKALWVGNLFQIDLGASRKGCDVFRNRDAHLLANEHVVTKDQRDWLISNELLADQERLSDSARIRLLRIRQGEAKVGSVAEKGLNGRKVSRGTNDQDLVDAAGHEGPDWVVDHRLVVDREELLTDTLRGGVEATPATASKHNPPHAFTAAEPCARARSTCQITVARSASEKACCGAKPSSPAARAPSSAYR